MSIARFNAKLARAGIPLELVKGQGYLYFVTVPPHSYASHSVYVYAFSHLTVEQWMQRAEEAWADMQAHGQGSIPTPPPPTTH